MAAVFALVVVCAAQNDTLFPSNQIGVSIFGEADQGNIDSSPTQHVVYGTQTFVTGPAAVAAPTGTATATGSGAPQLKRAVKSAGSFKPAFAILRGDDPYKRTYVTRHVKTTDRLQHNAGGGGVELNYFFNRYVGVSLQGDFLGGYGYNTVGVANLIFRYPFEFGAATSPAGYSKDGKSTVDSKDGKSVVTGPTWGIAPYVVMGGGAQWDGRCEGVGDVGGGLEFRFKQHYGIFLEGRWVVHDARQNYASETAGVSYNF